ncbi:ABC transporter ATP-binding protein, partial [Streptomyces sp. NPDC054837]
GMDRLVVLDRGRVIEQGSHEELLTAQGAYARLWQHQSGGFLGESDQQNATCPDQATGPTPHVGPALPSPTGTKTA